MSRRWQRNVNSPTLVGIISESCLTPLIESVFRVRSELHLLSSLPVVSEPMFSLTLENNGSVARDHLASERTFLAYTRTSLVLASTGVALVQLISISSSASMPVGDNATTSTSTGALVHRYARPLGATTVLLALLFLVVGITRYFSIQNKLTKGVFPVARTFIVCLALVLAVLVIIVFVMILARS